MKTSDNIHILVAEDDCDMRELIERVIKEEGYNVSLAENGEQACEILRKEDDIKIVITDIRMPKVDGPEVLEEALKVNPDIKVIFMTAFGEVEQYLELMNKGAFDYLNKPFKVTELARMVARAVESLE